MGAYQSLEGEWKWGIKLGDFIWISNPSGLLILLRYLLILLENFNIKKLEFDCEKGLRIMATTYEEYVPKSTEFDVEQKQILHELWGIRRC